MATQHNALTGSDLHEPKGADTATAGKVYVSDGSGSGSWTAREQKYSGVIADVSTSETVYVPISNSGTVSKVTTVLEGTISTSDAIITVSNSAAASMGTITVTQSGSASGDVDSLSPSANNTVTNDDYITVQTNGASTGSAKLWFTVTVLRDS